jgi:hypothetical protein
MALMSVPTAQLQHHEDLIKATDQISPPPITMAPVWEKLARCLWQGSSLM